MKKLLAISLALVITGVGLLNVVEARTVSVKGYYKPSSSTYVQPYYRSSPNAYRYDNRSYSGGSLYNRSYSYPTRNYSSSWYTPRYDYWSW